MSGCLGAEMAGPCRRMGRPSAQELSPVFESNIRSFRLHRVSFSPQTRTLLARRLSEAPCSLEHQKAALLFSFLSEVDLFSAFSARGGQLRAKPWLSPTDFNTEGGLQRKLNQALAAHLDSKGVPSQARFAVVDSDRDSYLLEISFI